MQHSCAAFTGLRQEQLCQAAGATFPGMSKISLETRSSVDSRAGSVWDRPEVPVVGEPGPSWQHSGQMSMVGFDPSFSAMHRDTCCGQKQAVPQGLSLSLHRERKL